MPINISLLNPIKPLRYSTKIGQSVLATHTVFPVDGSTKSNFIVGEQQINLSVSGLKIGTVHRAFLNGVDVTQYCKQVGRRLGEGLISSWQTGALLNSSTSAIGGEIFFTFYFRPEILANTPVEQSASEASLLGGKRVLTIRSDDNSSFAEIEFSLPKFATEEPNITIKKNYGPSSTKSSNVEIVASSSVKSSNYIQPTQYNLVQTFFADKEIVQGAGEVYLTSVDLFFRKKPDVNTSVSGNPHPGVTIAICEVENNQPIIQKTLANTTTRKDYDEIFSYADGSTPVSFSFDQTIKLQTDKFYGIIIILEDPAYELWQNKIGDKLVGTNTPSSGSNANKDGKLFLRNNSGVFNSQSGSELKFDLKCAKFLETSETKKFVPLDYEFFTISNRLGNFIGGESVFQIANNETGTISVQQGSNRVIGSGTSFTQFADDEYFIISTGDGSGDNHVAIVDEVANDTFMTITSQIPFSNTAAVFKRTVLGKLYYQDVVNNRMFLVDSTANTITFVANSTIKGVLSAATAKIESVDNLSIDRIRLQGDVSIPAAGSVDFSVSGANFNGLEYNYNPNSVISLKPNSLTTTNVVKQNQFILSRSNELTNSSLFTNEELSIYRKSMLLNVNLASDDNPFTSPNILNSRISVIVGENSISSTVDLDQDGVLIDTEVSNSGNARSRHIANKLSFDEGRFAEDLKIYMTAYRPIGTEIRLYAKLHNSNDSEPFDDKVWTPLTFSGSTGQKFSSSEDQKDFIEYELTLPKYSPALATSNVSFTASGSVLTSTDSARLNPSNFVANNEIIRVYDPLFGEDEYRVAPVLSANSTSIVLTEPVSNGNVLIDKLKYPTIGFSNPNNDGEVRYFNSDSAAFDGFDTIQVKVVFLSNNTYIAPKVDQLQVIGVSV